MVQELKEAPRRTKKKVPAMYPVKEWLSLDEACSYMDMSKNEFLQLATEKRLTISVPKVKEKGKKKFYRVSELKAVLENSIIAYQI